MIFRKNANGAKGSSLPDSSSDESPGRQQRAGQTIVGSQTRIRGTLKGTGGMLVQGSVEGEIDLGGGLIISLGGQIEAEADVQTLQICGRASGSMKVSDRVQISSTGSFEGKMSAPLLDMHPGSILRGKASIAGLAPPRRHT